MGCANSMPLNGSGGMVEAAKNAVNETVHAGEEALHDVGESLNGAAVSVKEAVIGAVKSIGHGVDGVADDVSEAEQKITETMKTNVTEHVIPKDENGEPLYKKIPLKDSNPVSFDDDMDEFKDMLSKMSQEENINNEIKKTSMNVVDVVEKDVKTKIDESVQELTEMVMTDKTPTHSLDDSLDSLKTSTPEPEIINAMLNDAKSAPSPKPTLAEMKSIEEMDEIFNDQKL